MVRLHMTEILQLKELPGGEAVQLSTVKRLFRLRGLELSETALGHSKLSELLSDSHLSDLCTVKLQEHGYFVVPQSEPLTKATDDFGFEPFDKPAVC